MELLTEHHTSHNPRTGLAAAHVPASTPGQVDAAVELAAAGAPVLAATSPADRATWLRGLAAALELSADELAAVADEETGLGRERLDGEVLRAAAQLRHYAEAAIEGSWLDATIDHTAGAAGSDLRRSNVPLGPIAVFAASNFPFAFGVCGNDTGAALASGCPVVVKGHPAQPRLSAAVAAVMTAALTDAGAPAGTFALVSGFSAGEQLVLHPAVAAVAFTGSPAGGFALSGLAASRPVPIPVFAELGTINPVVVSTGAAAARGEAIATGLVASATLGAGQFCTKPGLVLVPAGSGFAARTAQALIDQAPQGWLLTEGIAAAYAAGVADLITAGATVVAEVPAATSGWGASATVLSASADQVLGDPTFHRECFGPVTVLVEHDSREQRDAVLSSLPGALAASVFAEPEETEELADLVARLSARAGRVVVNGFPTGVATTWAQHHGGPWPATTAPGYTSVGAGGLRRFVRPVCLQDAPHAVLPPAVRDENPWCVPQRVDGRLHTTTKQSVERAD
jgi:NADP-dependent aldehyde dehydrogenase